nr:MAG TPA: hypothetical protein [Crassvirales sp.]
MPILCGSVISSPLISSSANKSFTLLVIAKYYDSVRIYLCSLGLFFL